VRNIIEKVAIYAMQIILDYFVKKHGLSDHDEAYTKLKKAKNDSKK
jgi:hypothetical protein